EGGQADRALKGQSSAGLAIRLMRSRGAWPLQFFLTKARTSFCRDRIYFWSNGSHAAVFPRRSGTGSCAAPFLSDEIRHVHRVLLAAQYYIERHLGGVLVNNQIANSTGGFMARKLEGKKVAILVTDGFEQVEMTKPRQALDEAGAETKIVSLKSGQIQGMHHADKGDKFDVDLTLNDARPDDFDALMIPGGLMNPDALRSTDDAVEFTRHFFEGGKPVAAICHAPWVLIDAGVVRGRTLTSWPAIKTDVKNAGGKWVNEEVVVDNGLVTSRKPDDIPAFNRKMIEEFCEGKHDARKEVAAATLET